MQLWTPPQCAGLPSTPPGSCKEPFLVSCLVWQLLMAISISYCLSPYLHVRAAAVISAAHKHYPSLCPRSSRARLDVCAGPTSPANGRLWNYSGRLGFSRGRAIPSVTGTFWGSFADLLFFYIKCISCFSTLLLSPNTFPPLQCLKASVSGWDPRCPRYRTPMCIPTHLETVFGLPKH